MGLHREEDIEIARRTAARAGLALVGEADPGAVLDALRDLDVEGLFLAHQAVAAAIAAGIADHPAVAGTDRAGPFDGEEALALAHLAVAVAGRAGGGLGARLRRRSRGRFAGDRGRNLDGRALAVIGVLETDLEIELEIGAAPGALLAPGAAHELAEQVVEHIGEIAAEVEPARRAVAAAAMLEGGMAETVIGRALVVILEDVVGLVDFLETVFGGLRRRDCDRDGTAWRDGGRRT